MTKAKTFIQFLNQFQEASLKVTQKAFRDQRLTVFEKKIVEAQISLSNSDLDNVIDLLSPLTNGPDQAINGVKEIILGCAYNNKAMPEKAVIHLERGIDLISDEAIPERFHFVALSNLYSCYFNLGHSKELEKIINKMEQFKTLHQRDQTTLMLSKLSYYNMCSEFKLGQKIIHQLDEKVSDMDPYQYLTYHLDKFDHYFKQDKYDDCYEVLDEIKRVKKFHNSSNFKLMKTLLDFINGNKTLYIYARDYQDSPINFHQMMIIKYLDEGQLYNAEIHWKELQKVSPQWYKSQFQYAGTKSLFSISLAKFDLSSIKSKEIKQEINYENLEGETCNKVEFLYKILQQQELPISKEDLYRQMYGEDYNDKSDFKKLVRLIGRLNEAKGLELKAKKGCYFLPKKAA